MQVLKIYATRKEVTIKKIELKEFKNKKAVKKPGLKCSVISLVLWSYGLNVEPCTH